MFRYLGSIISDVNHKDEFYTTHDATNTKAGSSIHDEIWIHRDGESDKRPADFSDLSSYAILLNSPWSQSSEKYTIKVNCKDGYTDIDPDQPIWICEYTAHGYDTLITSVIGYGDTPEEALKDCVAIFDMLQKQYNEDDTSI